MLEASDTSSVICSCMVYAGRVLQTKGMQDQVLTLVLLGQIEMAKAAKGMLVAFIDFTKAYDKVDRVKLWGCLELKLSTTKLIGECEVELSCALVKSKAERRMMLKLRGGTAALQIEVGRWHGMKREERVCKECDSGEVEDVFHWLLQCSAWDHLRQLLLEAMEGSKKDFPAKSIGERAALVLSLACKNYRVLSIISSMWTARFY